MTWGRPFAGAASASRVAVAAVCAALFLLILAGSARADPEVVQVDHPPPPTTVNGGPSSPGLKHLTFSYDPAAGSITFTVDFYNSADAIDPSTGKYAWWIDFSVGHAMSLAPYGWRCDDHSGDAGVITGQHHVYAASERFYDQFSVFGYSGEVTMTRTGSDSNGGTEITVTGHTPVIANQPYSCLTYQLDARIRSTASNLNSSYDESCDCWYVATTDAAFDNTPGGVTAGNVATVWFPGQGPLTPPPQSQAPPSISGAARQGQTLQETHGAWSNSPTSYAYQWQRCDAAGNNCQPIAGATSQSYKLAATDVGRTIRVAESATNAAGGTGSALSAPTPVVLPSPPSSTAAPKISGSPVVGQKLSETRGNWASNPTAYSYQWQRCDRTGKNCQPIAGATSRTYNVVPRDLGHTIKVSESAANAGGTGTSAASRPTQVVRAPLLITLRNSRGWARSAVLDQFYGGNPNTSLNGLTVTRCAKLAPGKIRCHVSWRRRSIAYAGAVTMGDANPVTGYFTFGFNLVRTDTSTGAHKRVVVRY